MIWFHDPHAFYSFDPETQADLLALYSYIHTPPKSAKTGKGGRVTGPQAITAMLKQAAGALPPRVGARGE